MCSRPYPFFIALAVFFFTLSLLPACAQTEAGTVVTTQPPATQSEKQSTAQASSTSEPAAQREIVIPIGKSDEVDITVFGVPDLSTHQRVNSLGDISMPLIDYVHIEGLTSYQAEQVIEKRLISGGYIKNPHVTVFVKEFTTAGVSVLGQVKNPGIYPVVASRRLWDMVLAAGGTTDRAGNMVTIH